MNPRKNKVPYSIFPKKVKKKYIKTEGIFYAASSFAAIYL